MSLPCLLGQARCITCSRSDVCVRSERSEKCVWVVWKDEGVGCLMCFNYRLALTRAGLTPRGADRRLSKECPWASFKMLIFRKSALRRHEETVQHRKAAAFHATGKLTCEGTNFLEQREFSKETDCSKGVPTPAALKRLCSAVQRGIAFKAIVAQETATESGIRNFESFFSYLSVSAAVGVLAETLRQQWRSSFGACKPAVASDSRKEVDAVTFRHLTVRKY